MKSTNHDKRIMRMVSLCPIDGGWVRGQEMGIASMDYASNSCTVCVCVWCDE